MKFKIVCLVVAAFLLVASQGIVRAADAPATQPATTQSSVSLIGFWKASIYVQIVGADEDAVSYRPIRAAGITYIKDNSKFQIINLSDARGLTDYPHILVTFGSVANSDGTHTCKAGVFVFDNKKIIYKNTVTGTCPADKVVDWAKQMDIAMLKTFVTTWNAENPHPPATTQQDD
ncbi:MAG TPA: hypothetical protein VKJ65_13680 [Phycisphaerae bacterium]|nr:hypothetical protein [Phycisphaerae bacterium]